MSENQSLFNGRISENPVFVWYRLDTRKYSAYLELFFGKRTA